MPHKKNTLLGQNVATVLALRGKRFVELDAIDALSGLRSLPFPRPVRLATGGPWGIVVKMIDAQGNERRRVLTEDGSV